MTIETATDPKDDFEGAFASFATPGAEVDKNAAPAAAATSGDGTDTGAATGGTDGSGDAGAAAGSGDSGAAGAAADGDGGAGAGEGAAAPAAAEEGAKTPAADDKGAAAGEGGAAPAGDAGAAPAAAASDDKSAKEVLDRLSKLVAEAKPAAEEKKPVEEKKPEEQATYSDDEQKRLTEYDKDWKEVSECEALRRRGEYKELLGFVFGEVQKAMAPLQQTVDALAGRTHLADVKAAVGDYSDNLRQQVIDWVVKQPAYLQPAYNHVIENGTADEVKDLVDRYRQASGQAAPAAGAAPSGQPGKDPAKDNELSGAAKEAAAALAPVESKRSEVHAPGDPSSFEDAWSQFAKDLA